MISCLVWCRAGWRLFVLVGLLAMVPSPTRAQPGGYSPSPAAVPYPELAGELGWRTVLKPEERIRELQQQLQADPKSTTAAERWLEIAYLYDTALKRPVEAAQAYQRAAGGPQGGAGGCGGTSAPLIITAADRYRLYCLFRAGEILHALPDHRKRSLGLLQSFYYAVMRVPAGQRAQFYLPDGIEERALWYIDQEAQDTFFYRLFDVLVLAMGARPGLSHALALVLLALLLKVLFHPLMRRQYISMIKMQRVQPIVQEIQRKYKADPQKAQKAMMEVYREYGVSPLGGCLPMLIQMPLLIMVYNGIRLYIYHFHQASFLWIRSMADADLPLLLIYAVSMFIQQKLTSSMTARADDPAMQQQQRMMMFMPVFFTYMMWVWRLPSAFYFYWIAYNVLSTLEQRAIMKGMEAVPAESVDMRPPLGDGQNSKRGHRERRQFPVTVLGEHARRGRRGRRSRR